jgi:hypothetical protein
MPKKSTSSLTQTPPDFFSVFLEVLLHIKQIASNSERNLGDPAIDLRGRTRICPIHGAANSRARQ